MEFLKRKHFSLSRIILFILIGFIRASYGLQGVPTWMCLGLKSPFIEFQAEFEFLANTSIALNITKDEQALMHQEGLQKLGKFIKPIDLRNSTTGFVISNLTKKVPATPASFRRKGITINPIAEEMDQKEIELLEEDPNDADQGFPGLTDEDRKFIVPMALKNPTNEPKRFPVKAISTSTSTTSTTTTTTTTTSLPDSSNNIEDLKNHILMLQSLSKNDKSFQSKFVVFPSLQRERNSTQRQIIIKPTTKVTTTTTTKRTPTKSFTPIPTRTRYEEHDYFDNDEKEFFMNKEKITIIPQVLLLNDQTPPDDDDELDYEAERRRADAQRRDRMYARRRNFRKSSTFTTTTSTTSTPPKIGRRNQQKRQRNGERRNNNKKQRLQNCKNIDTPKCQRLRRKQQQQQEQQMGLSLNINKTSISSSAFSQLVESKNPSQDNNNNKGNNGFDSIWKDFGGVTNDQKLSRTIRSHSRRNTGSVLGLPYYDGSTNRDYIIPVNSNVNSMNFSSNQTIPYKENIDINPDLCQKVDGMTYGQQKLCILHTNTMPAISRGARSAIQECKHQFKNRRWNCSTVDDNTVFGPMSTIGSPEMAFIHALAAATVTSFIARACRDGQLASCGCSRSARPKQLHDDWTWGGCGDDLEFAYKFSQEFIDIREKELRKRGTRGLVSIPPKDKFSLESTNNSTNVTHTPNSDDKVVNQSTTSSSIFKPEDLLELQEKITKEILNSKLQEKEMLELQEKINREIMNSKVFNLDHQTGIYSAKKHQKNPGPYSLGRFKNGMSAKARSLMNLHNNEAGRRAVIKKTRITCKCHGVSGSCSMITCWQQLSSVREIGDYLREKYDEATEVKLNKRGRLQVKDPRYKVPTAHDLVYLDESPDWCRNNKQIQWPGTHGRVCNKTSSGLDGCGILCCGRGYNTKNIVVRERCNCKFHWCCQVKCEICVKVLEEHTCK